LVDAKLKNPDLKLESLKAVLVGGGKVEPDSMARIRALLCRNVLSQYGSTEAGVTALAPFDLLARTPGAVGFVLPWTDLQIVDDSGEVLAAGLEGLVRYRTPQLMENLRLVGPGNIPGVQDGWFYPGDIGYVNVEGVLCLTGRSSDVINRGGVKVSGTRIEEILSALPGVKEVAACGVAGEHFEEIWIAIVPDGSIDVEDISRYLREHKDIGVAADQVFLLDAFPRGELGKIQKPRLKELLRHRSQAR
jgi:acyl-CoA synthetase (AMP-forming)/AMP-acid ligase II